MKKVMLMLLSFVKIIGYEGQGGDEAPEILLKEFSFETKKQFIQKTSVMRVT